MTSTRPGRKKKNKSPKAGAKSTGAIVKAKKPTAKPSRGQLALAGAMVSVPLAWFIVPLRRALAVPIRPLTARSRRRQCNVSMVLPTAAFCHLMEPFETNELEGLEWRPRDFVLGSRQRVGQHGGRTFRGAILARDHFRRSPLALWPCPPHSASDHVVRALSRRILCDRGSRKDVIDAPAGTLSSVQISIVPLSMGMLRPQIIVNMDSVSVLEYTNHSMACPIGI